MLPPGTFSNCENSSSLVFADHPADARDAGGLPHRQRQSNAVSTLLFLFYHYITGFKRRIFFISSAWDIYIPSRQMVYC
jgi:hypothetical protein